MKPYYKILVVILLCCYAAILYAEAEKPVETIENKAHVMYLTFDDGPSEYTSELLDLLKAHHMQVTFFMLDAEMKRNPEVVKRILEEGHAIGLHGVSHEKNIFYRNTETPLNEMETANATLEEITGEKTYLIRTPYGSNPYLTKKQYSLLCEHHYILWDWNVDSRDWCYRNPQRTYLATTQMINQSKAEPKVVLFHDMKNVVPTMKLFIDWMEKNHYISEKITPDLEPVKLNYKPYK